MADSDGYPRPITPIVPPDWGRYLLIADNVDEGVPSGFHKETLKLLDHVMFLSRNDDAETPSEPYQGVGKEQGEAEELCRLPSWFLVPQPNDKYDKIRARRMPAVVVLEDANNAVCFVAGSFDEGDPFRFHASCLTTFPTFAINVRENHRVREHRALYPDPQHHRRRPMAESRLSPGDVRDPNKYNNNHIEDDLQFDPDVARKFSVKIVDELPGKLHTHLVAAKITLPEHRYGVLTYTVGRTLPARSYGQSRGFSVDSQQYKFFSQRPRTYTVICSLTAQDDLKTWDVYAYLTNYVRTLSNDGMARSDWFSSRDERYKPHTSTPFANFVDKQHLKLPAQGWLQGEEGNGFNSLYPASQDQKLASIDLPRKLFPSLQTYMNHFIPALLYERAEDIRQWEALYNSDRTHYVEFRHEHDDRYTVYVRVNRRNYRGSMLVPFTATEVTVYLPDPAYFHPDYETKGKVYEANENGFDFRVKARVKDRVKKQLAQAGHEFNATIHLIYTNNEIHRKLQSLQSLQCTGFRQSQDARELPLVHGRRRGKFELASIIGEQRLDVWSPDFNHVFRAADNVGAVPRTRNSILNDIAELVEISSMNSDQHEFFKMCFYEGVPGNVAILKGLPGTGKSQTLGFFIAALLLIGVQVVGTGHSNAAAKALRRCVLTVIDNHEHHIPRLSTLRSKILQAHSPHREEYYMENLRSNTIGVEIPDDCLSRKVMRYAYDHQDEKDASDFLKLTRARQMGSRKAHGVERQLPAVIHCIERKVIDDTLFVVATTFAASSLTGLGFRADVCIIDEAAQATEPDALCALHEQPNIRLLVLSGDEMQLPPLVKSLQARSNPLANILAISLVTRLLTGYPHIRRVVLTKNYRSHPDLIALPSQIFYNGLMHSANVMDWNTRLAANVHALLLSGRFHGMTRRAAAMRQVFFNVGGEPEQEAHSFSYTNPKGVQAVSRFVKLLVDIAHVDPQDIGIITPYKYDKLCLGEMLTRIGLVKFPEIATVDAFQGREKTIVIVHFVCAFRADNPFGFVANANRLCVTTTRAQEYQFLFGNMGFWRGRLEAKKDGLKLKSRHQEMAGIMGHVQNQGQLFNWSNVTPLPDEAAATEGQREGKKQQDEDW